MLEMLDEWGERAFIERGLRVNVLQYWERDSRELVAQFDYAHIAGDTRFPFRLQRPQSLLTRTMLPALLATGCAEVHFGHRLTAFALANKLTRVMCDASALLLAQYAEERRAAALAWCRCAPTRTRAT